MRESDEHCDDVGDDDGEVPVGRVGMGGCDTSAGRCCVVLVRVLLLIRFARREEAEVRR